MPHRSRSVKSESDVPVVGSPKSPVEGAEWVSRSLIVQCSSRIIVSSMTYDICRCSISWESLGNFQGGKGTPWIYARNYSKSLICSFRWLSLADLLLKNLLPHSMVTCFMNAPCLKCLASGSQECGGLLDRHNEGCHFDLIWFHTQSSRTAGSNWNRCCQHDLWVRPSGEVKQVCYSCYSEIHDWIH